MLIYSIKRRPRIAVGADEITDKRRTQLETCGDY